MLPGSPLDNGISAIASPAGGPGDGTRVLQDHVLDIDQRFAYPPRRLPASNHISLGEIPPGDYRARLSFMDGIGGSTWTEVVPFSVRH